MAINKKKERFYKDFELIEQKIFEPFNFEENIFKFLNNKKYKIKEMEEYKGFRLHLIPILKCLKENKKYPNLVKPLNF